MWICLIFFILYSADVRAPPHQMTLLKLEGSLQTRGHMQFPLVLALKALFDPCNLWIDGHGHLFWGHNPSWALLSAAYSFEILHPSLRPRYFDISSFLDPLPNLLQTPPLYRSLCGRFHRNRCKMSWWSGFTYSCSFKKLDIVIIYICFFYVVFQVFWCPKSAAAWAAVMCTLPSPLYGDSLFGCWEDSPLGGLFKFVSYWRRRDSLPLSSLEASVWPTCTFPYLFSYPSL